jgi:hypothetical protein
MNKLLREVPTMESWVSESSASFVQVTLDKDFIQAQLTKLNGHIGSWLQEPLKYSNGIGNKNKTV